MPDEEQVEAVRVRREAIHQAMTGLEIALTTPVGDAAQWHQRVTAAVDGAVQSIGEHIEQTEAPGGFLDQVITDQPRLANRVTQMKVDHERLEKSVDALRVAIEQVDDENAAQIADVVRDRAMDLVNGLARHRQNGSDLIYEAYHVDLGSHG